MLELTADEARRIALAAQGFARGRPARAGEASIRSVVRSLGLLQIDSVNVLARAHYLPVFSRLGRYDPQLLDRLAYRRRALFEYWGHEASLIDVDLRPLFVWRMEEAADRGRYLARWARGNAAYVEAVFDEVARRGPTGVSDLSEPGTRSGPWWGWAEGKTALEWLFFVGRLSVADRRNFERLYDLTERVIPASVLERPAVPRVEAHRRLLLLAARSLGIGTARDLADYFRLKVTPARALLAELVEDGALRPVRVEGWKQPAYLHPEARAPRRVDARALLAPFDPLVWERDRAERLFGFRYRIEIYVPAPKRVYGYYVLPFLLGDRLVARVDLKSDRAASVLRVNAAFLEPGAGADSVAAALAEELHEMAAWLGLEGVAVARRGDLARALVAAVGRTGRHG